MTKAFAEITQEEHAGRIMLQWVLVPLPQNEEERENWSEKLTVENKTYNKKILSVKCSWSVIKLGVRMSGRGGVLSGIYV